jgi:hypothetical protein
MSELWPFYLLFRAHNFSGLLRAYFSSKGNEISTELKKTSVTIAPKRAFRYLNEKQSYEPFLTKF